MSKERDLLVEIRDSLKDLVSRPSGSLTSPIVVTVIPATAVRDGPTTPESRSGSWDLDSHPED